MRRITEQIWVETEYEGANVGFILTQKGVICVESPMSPPDIRDWLSKIRSVTDAEIAYVISTDHHFDHSIGDWSLGGKVIMHESCLEGLREVSENYMEMFERFFEWRYHEVKDELDQIKVEDPDIIFSERITLLCGDVTVEVVHIGGHCDGTSYVYVPQEKVLFTGDAVSNGQHPYLGDAIFDDWVKGLHRMMELDVRYLVPGHGEVGDKSAIERLIRFFELMGEKVKRGEEDIGDLYDFYPIRPERRDMVADWLREGLERMREQMRGGL
jgi:glyoxylase-like metal-dependent hydrolase (beta-lactamase superfamily II)